MYPGQHGLMWSNAHLSDQDTTDAVRVAPHHSMLSWLYFSVVVVVLAVVVRVYPSRLLTRISIYQLCNLHIHILGSRTFRAQQSSPFPSSISFMIVPALLSCSVMHDVMVLNYGNCHWFEEILSLYITVRIILPLFSTIVPSIICVSVL